MAAPRVDFAQDLARIHTEATGGRERLAALKSLKATGTTQGEAGELRFTMWAARPNRIRTEVSGRARTITQGWNGKGVPWSADSLTRRIMLMSGVMAEDFKTEAEFDDPLLLVEKRQVSLDYAGETSEGGRTLLKVLVTQNFTATSFVYVDAETYLIVRRDVMRRQGGAETVVRTDYSDFRAVAGVVLPHRLVVTRDGNRVNETVIDQMEANVALPEGLFSVPKVPSVSAAPAGR